MDATSQVLSSYLTLIMAHGPWHVIGRRLITVIGQIPIHACGEGLYAIGHGHTRPIMCMVLVSHPFMLWLSMLLDLDTHPWHVMGMYAHSNAHKDKHPSMYGMLLGHISNHMCRVLVKPRVVLVSQV